MCEGPSARERNKQSSVESHSSQKVVKMDRYDRAMLKLDALTQGRYESPTTYGKRVWKLLLQVDEDEESWVVRKFIDGIRDEELWRILRAERNSNKAMGLGVVMRRLKALYKLRNESGYDPGPDSEEEYDESDSDSEFAKSGSNLTFIVVNTMPHHLLSNPVAFNQFLKRKNFRPSFDWSGPFSRKSIQALHAAHGKQSSAASQEKHNQVAEESPKVIAKSICMITADSTSQQSERITDTEICSQSKETPIPRNELPPPDLWVELPFHRDLTADASSVAAIEPMAVNAQSGLSSETLEAADCELDVLTFADEGMDWYQNTTGEKKVEKWREKDEVMNELAMQRDASMMVLGLEIESFTQDLIGTLMKKAMEQRANMVTLDQERSMASSGHVGQVANIGGDNCGTTVELASTDRLRRSDESTSNELGNPSIRPIRTASEWDPGPENLEEAIPATGEGKGPLSIAFGDLRFVNPEQQGVEPNVRSPTPVMATTSPELKETHRGYQFRDVADVSSRAIRNPVVQRIRTASKWDLGPCESEYTSLALEDGNKLYKLTFGNPLAVERRRAEPETRDLTGIIAKPTPHGPMHPMAEFLWPPEDGVRQACHTALTRSISMLNARYCLSGMTGQVLRGGIDTRRIWDPGGDEA